MWNNNTGKHNIIAAYYDCTNKICNEVPTAKHLNNQGEPITCYTFTIYTIGIEN